MLWVGGVANEPFHSLLLCASDGGALNDAQTLVLNVILGKILTSLAWLTHL